MIFLTLHNYATHAGKELHKQFLSIPAINSNPSQGGDLDMGADPDIEIVHEDVKFPHLECLCLHLGDHTRDTEDVSLVSDILPTAALTISHFLLYVDLGRVRKKRNRHHHRHARGRPRGCPGDLALFGCAHKRPDISHEPTDQPPLGRRPADNVL